MTRRFLTGRTSSKGCVKSTTRVTARRWMRYSRRMNGRTSIAACCALRIFDAATICIALVICAVLRIDLMRRRISRVLAIRQLQSGLNAAAAAFNAFTRSSLSAFSRPICSSRLAFDVVRNSVNRF